MIEQRSTRYADRDKEIRELRAAGLTLQAIADHFSLSRQRIFQIIRRSRLAAPAQEQVSR